MAYDTLIQQGRFTSTGVNVYIPLRGGVDWFETYNQTQIGAAGAAQGVRFWWQLGMGSHSFVMEKTAVTNALTLVDVSPGLFTFVDQGNPLISPLLGNPVATTAETNAVQPVVSTANTAGLSTGSVVRLSSVAAIPNLMGFDFEIDTVNANANFRMRFPLANVPGAAGGAGFYRQVNFNSPFYPQNRYIINITQANPMIVDLSVTADYQVGQQIRFNIPAAFGMVQLDGLVGDIIAVNGNALSIDIDSTAFSPFVIPAIALYPFTWAQCVPVGENTSVALALNANILSDATVNQSEFGMILAAGATGPAGQAADVIYWRAGKSFSVSNM
jgi:hypothetical protein